MATRFKPPIAPIRVSPPMFQAIKASPKGVVPKGITKTGPNLIIKTGRTTTKTIPTGKATIHPPGTPGRRSPSPMKHSAATGKAKAQAIYKSSTGYRGLGKRK